MLPCYCSFRVIIKLLIFRLTSPFSQVFLCYPLFIGVQAEINKRRN
nr:MAG TPA: hypothetical protein [Caudoviricetes sp.]